MTELRGTESILVVDDEPVLTELAAEILSDAGYQVKTSYSGEEALRLMSNFDFDMLFTDVIMPGMTGYRLVKEVLDQYPNTKILLTSGYQLRNKSPDIPEKLLNNVVTKPYGDRKLLRAVRACLDE